MKLALAVLFAVLLAACAAPTPDMQGMVHNSRNSLDWAGAYEGTLPCADCPGIATRVELALDQTYVLSLRYIDRDAAPRVTRGTFTWDDQGRSIELQSWRFQVREGSLALLDREGRPITGALAQNYVLKKL